jgi:glycosyltransferase involved in cell wall biosynthesis
MSTLSVLISNYNHAHYLGEALTAILRQSWRPSEIIIIDDASTDDSVAVIQRVIGGEPGVTFLQNEQNRGVVTNANHLLNSATGDYIYFAAADDLVRPGFFEKSMRLLAVHPKAGLCCSDPATFESESKTVSANPLNWGDEARYFSPDELVAVIDGGFIPGHTSLVKRSAALEAGAFLPELQWHCDWFQQLVVGFRQGVCYIPEPLATMRILQQSYSAAGRRDWSLQCEVLNQLFRLLKSDGYRDVLPHFQRANVVSGLGPDVVRVVRENKEHWDRASLKLIRRHLQIAFNARVGPATPLPIKRAYRRLRGRSVTR